MGVWELFGLTRFDVFFSKCLTATAHILTHTITSEVNKSLFYLHLFIRYKLNIWDVGGQKSLRSYWRNYFESTDGLVWVVDSADRRRLDDCRRELEALLVEEVGLVTIWSVVLYIYIYIYI